MLPSSGPARLRLPFPVWVLLLMLAALGARLPLCREPAAVRNDGAEYLAIARSLRTTGEYATDLKYHFYTADPVRHPALADRPPLYPLLAALCARAFPWVHPTQAACLGNALIACGALALAAGWLRRLYGERIALFAAGYSFLLPHSLYWTTQPMTEAVSLALSFGALWLWTSGRARGGGLPGAVLAAAAGVLGGLTYLARPTGMVLLLVFVLDAARRRKQAPAAAAAALAAAAGFLLCAAPYHWLLWRQYGSPFHSALGYTFAVGTYYEVTYFGFETPTPSAMEFLARRWSELPALYARQLAGHAEALFLPLAALWPAALWMRRKDWAGERWASGALVVLSVLVHAAVWSAWGSSRYFLLPITLLAGALAASAARRAADEPAPAARRAVSLVPALSALGLAAALVPFYLKELSPTRGFPMLPLWKEAAAEVRGARLVASDRPQTLNLLAEVPAVMLPRTTDPVQLERFVERYRPDVLVLFIQQPLREAAEAQAASWRSGGLPAGWRLVRDEPRMLLARPAAPAAAP